MDVGQYVFLILLMMALLMADRDKIIDSFLVQCGWQKGHRRPLADDASFRRYERVCSGARSVVLMDAPPDYEDIKSFVYVANYLHKLGCSVPKILEIDVINGLLLLEDFGDDTYTKCLEKKPVSELYLYSLAVDTLVHLQRASCLQTCERLEIYRSELMIDEACVILDWYYPHVFGRSVPEGDRKVFRSLWKEKLNIISNELRVLVLRDYHVDNLIRLRGRGGILECGILDFQDAVMGSGIYDLMSLLEDARRDVTSSLFSQMKDRYFSAMSDLAIWPGGRKEFDRIFALLGAVRHAKVIGVFARLAIRDNKSNYLIHLPRVWSLLEQSLADPSLKELKAWFWKFFPKEKRFIKNQVEWLDR